jgi:predicted enzyme related to lactoylglutathione lyase
MMSVPGRDRSSWLFYFNDGEIDAALAHVSQNGGSVLIGSNPVPGSVYSAQCIDSQGAVFGLVGPRKS